MDPILILVLCGITLPISNAYVLVQVKHADGNKSNVDALIHKELPMGKFDRIANKMARKQLNYARDYTSNGRLHSKGAKSNDFHPNDLLNEVSNAVSQFLARAKTGTSHDVINQYRRNKQSLMYEVNSESVIKLLKDVLYSTNLQKYIERISRKAAIVYRAVKDELIDSPSL